MTKYQYFCDLCGKDTNEFNDASIIDDKQIAILWRLFGISEVCETCANKLTKASMRDVLRTALGIEAVSHDS